MKIIEGKIKINKIKFKIEILIYLCAFKRMDISYHINILVHIIFSPPYIEVYLAK